MGAKNAAFAAVTKALDEAFVRCVNAGEADRLVATCYAEDARPTNRREDNPAPVAPGRAVDIQAATRLARLTPML